MHITQPIISVDWLQIHVSTKEMRHRAKGYQIEKIEGAKSRTYSEVWKIAKDHRPVAQLQCAPFSPKLPPWSGVLKVENYILYTASRSTIIDQILTDLRLDPRGMTRIDICADFQKIADRDPQQLIQDIIEGQVRKVGHSAQSIICDEQQTAYGRREWQYLRYGSRSSRISTYMYNKTKELNDVSDKPYIRALWKCNGFAIKKRSTWRLEFSIKGRQMKFISTDTGEILPNDYKLWLTPSVATDVYRALCNHYFALVIPDHTRTRKCTPIPLWPTMGSSEIMIKYLDPTHHNNRADKIFIRKLANIASELYDQDTIKLAGELLERYVDVKKMNEWFKDNVNKTPQPYELQL